MKKSPLKRNTSLRESFLRKLKREGTKYIWSRTGDLKRKKPLKKVSKSYRNRLRVYYPLSQEFLVANPLCHICEARQRAGEDIQVNAATEIHHKRGRCGRLLTWVPGFVASCRACRDFPHLNPRKARDLGVLASATEWNVFPVE